MKFEPKILIQTEEFDDNLGETFDRYKGDDYEVFFNMYRGKKYMSAYITKDVPKIPDDVYYLTVSYSRKCDKFPKIPTSVRYLLLGVLTVRV